MSPYRQWSQKVEQLLEDQEQLFEDQWMEIEALKQSLRSSGMPGDNLEAYAEATRNHPGQREKAQW